MIAPTKISACLFVCLQEFAKDSKVILEECNNPSHLNKGNKREEKKKPEDMQRKQFKDSFSFEQQNRHL